VWASNAQNAGAKRNVITSVQTSLVVVAGREVKVEHGFLFSATETLCYTCICGFSSKYGVCCETCVCRAGVTNPVPPGTRSPAKTTLVTRGPVLKITLR